MSSSEFPSRADLIALNILLAQASGLVAYSASPSYRPLVCESPTRYSTTDGRRMYDWESESVVFARLPAGGGDTGPYTHHALTATGVGELRHH